MFNLKLKEGWHVVDGKKVKAGTEFQSKIDLSKCFPGRFEVLNAKEPVIEKDVINIDNTENNQAAEEKETVKELIVEKKEVKKKRTKRKSKAK